MAYGTNHYNGLPGDNTVHSGGLEEGYSTVNSEKYSGIRLRFLAAAALLGLFGSMIGGILYAENNMGQGIALPFSGTNLSDLGIGLGNVNGTATPTPFSQGN